MGGRIVWTSSGRIPAVLREGQRVWTGLMLTLPMMISMLAWEVGGMRGSLSVVGPKS